MTVPTEKHHSSSIIFPILIIIHFVHYYYSSLVMRKIHQIKIDHYIVPTSEIIFLS